VRRRFRARSARRSTTAMATVFRVGLNSHSSPIAPGGSASEANTRHHSHSVPSAVTRYGGVQASPEALSAAKAAAVMRSSAVIDSATRAQSSASVTARRTESSAIPSFDQTSRLSGRPTVAAKATAGRSGCRPDSTAEPPPAWDVDAVQKYRIQGPVHGSRAYALPVSRARFAPPVQRTARSAPR
jgi:hypothetical protein